MGVFDSSLIHGVNYGILTIYTPQGTADFRFDGQANLMSLSVMGSFALLDGTEGYEHLRGQGQFFGNAGPVFAVHYTPCGKHTGDECEPGTCFVRGGELSFHKNRVRWPLTNYGDEPITLDRVRIVWPEDNGALTEVRLGKRIYTGQLSGGHWDSDGEVWLGHDSDLRINQYQTKDLSFTFADDAGAAPSDYTVVVDFEEGCATAAVAFPAATPE